MLSYPRPQAPTPIIHVVLSVYIWCTKDMQMHKVSWNWGGGGGGGGGQDLKSQLPDERACIHTHCMGINV